MAYSRNDTAAGFTGETEAAAGLRAMHKPIRVGGKNV